MRATQVIWLGALALAALACEPSAEVPKEDAARPAPELVGVSPSTGVTLGGEEVRLTGSHLGKITAVAFGTASAELVDVSDDTLVVTTPPGERGKVDITATGSTGSSKLEDAFTYEQGVTIDGISPSRLPSQVEARATISGSGFVVAGANPTVKIGDTGVSIVSASDTSVEVVVPALPVGGYDVQVRNGDGHSAVAAGALQIQDPIEVVSATPNWAFATESAEIEVRGHGFSGAVAVLFGETEGSGLRIEDDSTLVVQSPLVTAPATVDLIVRRGPGDEGKLTAGFSFYDANDTTLRVLGVAPPHGRDAGGTQVVVGGTGFTNQSQVTFGGAAAIVDEVSANRLRVRTPAYTLGAMVVSAPVDVQVRNGSVSATLASGFTYYRAPQITQVDPTVLASAGGDTVMIRGVGFTIGSTQVFFGSVAARDVQVQDQTALTCVTNPHPEGEGVEVTVQTEYEVSAPYTVSFVEMTRIISVTPSTISTAGGTLITVEGTGFADAAFMSVTIDGNQVETLTRVDQTTLTFRTIRSTMAQGAKTLLIRNNQAGQQDTASLQASDLTDKINVHGGAPVAGNVNVTVLRADTEERLEGAVVFAGRDGNLTESTYNKGVTNADGLVVLSGDKVQAGPTVLTAGKLGFETQTIDGLDADRVTIFLTPHVAQSPAFEYGVITGTVSGWANVGLPEGNPAQRYYRVARVFASDTSPTEPNYPSEESAYALEIRDGQAGCQLVTGLSDSTYSVNSKPGNRAVLAVVYYWDSVDGVCFNQPTSGSQQCAQQNNQNCEGWLVDQFGAFYQGSAFGITTNVTVNGGGGATGGINIALNVPSVSYQVSANGNPTYLGATATAYTADAYLMLGNSGSFTFEADMFTNGTGMNFPPVPMVQGSWTYTVRAYVGAPLYDAYNQLAGFNTPISTSFARNLTSMSPQTLQTWIYFPTQLTFSEPAESAGQFSYSRSSGQEPHLTEVMIYDQGDASYTPLWSVLVNGDPRTVTLPNVSAEPRIQRIPAGAHYWDMVQIRYDSFNFNNFSREQIGSMAWRAAVQSEAQVFTKH